MVQAVAKVENPDTVEITIAITLPLARWKELQTVVVAHAVSNYSARCVALAIEKTLGTIRNSVSMPIEFKD